MKFNLAMKPICTLSDPKTQLLILCSVIHRILIVNIVVSFFQLLVPSCEDLCLVFFSLTKCHFIWFCTSHIASNGPGGSVCFLADTEEPSAGRPALREQSCVCEGGACERDRRCNGQQCFSAMRTVNGATVQQKGCLRDDEEGRATCATPPSSNHVVKCCQGHLCNMNVTVQAPGRGDFLYTVLQCKLLS